MPADIITQAELKEVLHYDPETGVFTWKVKKSKIINIGDQAGFLASGGYVSIGVSRKQYRAHCLAFLYMTGKLPSCQVDHINRVRTDNRWINLRLATNNHTDNSQNRKARSNSLSGLQGVSSAAHLKNKKWMARIYVDGKCTYLGLHDTPEEAHQAYLAKKRELHLFFVE